jgi:hypothetical protein
MNGLDAGAELAGVVDAVDFGASPNNLKGFEAPGGCAAFEDGAKVDAVVAVGCLTEELKADDALESCPFVLGLASGEVLISSGSLLKPKRDFAPVAF